MMSQNEQEDLAFRAGFSRARNGVLATELAAMTDDELASWHAWLQSGEWIVDITADQFIDVQESVIVTNKSEWHELWERQRPGRGTLREYGSQVPQLWPE